MCENVAKVRLYQADHEEANRILDMVKPMIRTMTLQEILREAVQNGLPAVADKYKAVIAAADAAAEKQKKG